MKKICPLMFQYVVFNIFVLFVNASKVIESPSYVDFYQDGKEAYLSNDWKDCVNKMEDAIEYYKLFTSAILKCKKDCKREIQSKKKEPPKSEDPDDDFYFYGNLVHETLCILKCRSSTVKEPNVHIPKEVVNDMETKLPYDYLQLCYFQLKDHKNAASAAYTYYIHNMENPINKANIDWYSEKLNLSEHFVDREPFLHTKSFISGDRAYNSGNWSNSVIHFEKALLELIEAEENCRFDCEKPFEMGWYPDFVTSVANHFVFCLKCKQKCQRSLSNIDGNQVNFPLQTIFNYLQFSYYKLGDIVKAANSVESFLELNPDDKSMLNNKNFYIKSLSADPKWFKVRPEAVAYNKRDLKEKNMLKFITENFAVFYPKEDESRNVSSDIDMSKHRKVANNQPKNSPKGETTIFYKNFIKYDL